VIGGAGVQRRRVLPHPRGHGKDGVAAGNHAIVLNVFTEPDWRRNGIAQRLMEAIIEWADAESLDRLVLHASAEGRPLYERLGFVPTNEMRFNRLFGPPVSSMPLANPGKPRQIRQPRSLASR